MNSLSRRNFLTKSASAIGVASMSTAIGSRVMAQSQGSNSDIRVAVVGLGIKGRQHLKVLNELAGVRVVALCDVDQVRLDEATAGIKDLGKTVRTYKDIRLLLEDDGVDAVVIATPNHWHALMAIWASQAGKDIYLEKPVCHDIWEGRRLLEAEKKYGRIIQGGTQNRSNTGFREGVQFLREGKLGKIKWIHGVDYKFRRSMGKVRGPQQIPSSVDYNLFCGPAQVRPLMRKNLHYDWHWQWDMGNGDMGNIAAHTIDNMRHIMGDDRQPGRVMSIGGRYYYDDDGETANVHLATYDYGDIQVFNEIRSIPLDSGASVAENLRGSRETSLVQCEGGYMLMSGRGVAAYSNDGKRIQAFTANGVKEHMQNFVDAVREQDASLLNCPLVVAVQAAEMFHLANLSYRSGFPAKGGQIRDAMENPEHAEEAIVNIEQNLERLEIDLAEDPITLGCWMSLDDSSRTLKVHNPDCDPVAQALFKKRQYRKPFAVQLNV